MSFSAKHLSFGLNKRSDKDKVGKGTSGRNTNVFGGEDDSSSDDGGESALSGKQYINRAIASEQQYMREKVLKHEKEMIGEVYDYDGAYDNDLYKKQQEEEEAEKKRKQEQQGSRYIGKLLKNAKIRKIENDMAYERKVAKEQMEEEQDNEYQGKEKFLTKSYRKKLEEREAYKRNEEKIRREEEENSVTKRGFGAMTGFYGNLSKNVAMGGVKDKVENTKNAAKDDENQNGEGDNNFNARESIEAKAREILQEKYVEIAQEHAAEEKVDHEEELRKTMLRKAVIRATRAEKVAAARERYFCRHNVKISAGKC